VTLMEEDRQSRLLGNAAGIVILTILGMIAGFTFGVIRSWIGPHDQFQQLGLFVSGGFVGSVLGLGLAIVLAVLDRRSFRSLKKTMIVVAVTAVVFWAIVTLLRDLRANGTL
jgi:hypothetical protein